MDKKRKVLQKAETKPKMVKSSASKESWVEKAENAVSNISSF
jgi:hypothetical protein